MKYLTLLDHWLILRNGERLERLRGVPSQPLKLRVSVQDGGRFSFSFADGGDFVAIPRTFQAAKGKWTGAKVGLNCLKREHAGTTAHADFDYFQFV